MHAAGRWSRAAASGRAGLLGLSCAALGLGDLLALGCGRGAPPSAPSAPPAHPKARIGRACPGLEPPAGALRSERARLFVELAQVAAGSLPEPLGPWLAEHPAPARAVVNLRVAPGQPAIVPWGDCVDAGCATRTQSIAARADFPSTGREPVRLHLTLQDGPGVETPSGHAPAAPLFETTLDLHHQTPVSVPGAEAVVGSETLVVTGYLLVAGDDLFRLMRCKAEELGTEELRPTASAR